MTAADFLLKTKWLRDCELLFIGGSGRSENWRRFLKEIPLWMVLEGDTDEIFFGYRETHFLD